MTKRWAAAGLALVLAAVLVLVVVARGRHDSVAAQPVAIPKASLSVILGNPSAASRTDAGPESVPTLTVRGPDGFVRFLTATSVLRDLEPGAYTVTASPADTPQPPPTEADRRLVVLPPQAAVDLRPGVPEALEFVAVPASVLRTSGGPHAFEAENLAGPVRWNPCAAITWAPTSELPAHEEALIAGAFDQAAADSGLTFVRVASPEAANVRVSVQFRPGTRVDGEGSMSYVPLEPQKQQVAISGAIDASIGQSTSDALRKALYLHEIGHVVGLSHVDDKSQVMHPEVSEADAVGFAAGDREGLKRVGAVAGCLNPPLAPEDSEALVVRDSVRLVWFQPASVPGVESSSLRVHTAPQPGLPDMYGTYPLEVVRVREGVGAAEVPGFLSDRGAMLGGATSAGGEGSRESSPVVDGEVGSVGGLSGWLAAEVSQLPGGVCAAGSWLELVVTNANGDTLTPVALSGCPSVSASPSVSGARSR